MHLTCRSKLCGQTLRKDWLSVTEPDESPLQHDERGDFIKCPKCGEDYYLPKSGTVINRSQSYMTRR
jgi:hypothetical protein